ATGLFATTAVNDEGDNALFYGNSAMRFKQRVAIDATYSFTIIMTYAIIKAINFFLPVRVDEHEEYIGLDISMPGEKAYEYT
ncbi:ammonia channel protein, partial [Bacillus anthracis]|nr:ammonia channel protein [Bacillus anthracis]